MKVKSTLLGILIGVIALPTITLGGSFVVSLVQGKTPTEAVQILATQLDSLMGRVDVIETEIEGLKQSELDAFDLPEPAPFIPIQITNLGRIEKELNVGKFYEKYPCGGSYEMSAEQYIEIDALGGCSAWQWQQFKKDPEYLEMIEKYNASQGQINGF